ncbi:MAG: hypothetical protein ACW99G_13860 [Candidatus Thorarchaeota archaeon]
MSKKRNLLILLVAFLMVLSTTVTVAASSKTQYPPFPGSERYSDAGQTGFGYHVDTAIATRTTGNIRLLVIGEGFLGGGAWAIARGFMHTTIKPSSSCVVSIDAKVTLDGFAKAVAVSWTPLGAWGRVYFRLIYKVYDATAYTWVTEVVTYDWDRTVWAPGGFIPVFVQKTWNYDKDVTGSFSAIANHAYRIYVGVEVYGAGFAIGGDGYGQADFAHSSTGDNDIWVDYIQLTW